MSGSIDYQIQSDPDIERIKIRMFMRGFIPAVLFLLSMPLLAAIVLDMISFDLFTVGTIAISVVQASTIIWANNRNGEILRGLDRDGVRFHPVPGSMDMRKTDVEHNHHVQIFFLLYMLVSMTVPWMMWFFGTVIV